MTRNEFFRKVGNGHRPFRRETEPAGPGWANSYIAAISPEYNKKRNRCSADRSMPGPYVCTDLLSQCCSFSLSQGHLYLQKVENG